jgi:hypothetical protein
MLAYQQRAWALVSEDPARAQSGKIHGQICILERHSGWRAGDQLRLVAKVRDNKTMNQVFDLNVMDFSTCQQDVIGHAEKYKGSWAWHLATWRELANDQAQCFWVQQSSDVV